MITGDLANMKKSLTAKFIINTFAGVCRDLHLKRTSRNVEMFTIIILFLVIQVILCAHVYEYVLT